MAVEASEIDVTRREVAGHAAAKRYQICRRCIMDTSDPLITFDERGICNHCKTYDARAVSELHWGEIGRAKLEPFIERIRNEGKGKSYDCIIGLSGGVDSSMVAYEVKKRGLRPLAVHLDNGWNSELAVSNIERLVKKLGIDLHTLVLDWEVFRDLHLAFIKASVANSEIPTDHAINATLYRTAAKEGIRYVISGSNVVTEAIMPPAWGYDSTDWRHIKAIHRRFGTRKLTGYPHLTLLDWTYYTFWKGIKFFPILNFIDYDKAAAKRLLQDEFGWRDYGGKHYESVYTRFFQGHILPRKFGFDKRRAHFSTMICAGQMARPEALEQMKHEPYPVDLQIEDRSFVSKKFGLSAEEFDKIMAEPPRQFSEYPNNHFWFEKLKPIVRLARRRAISAQE